MEEDSWIFSTSMPGNIETSEIDRNMTIPENLGAVTYDITNVLEHIENNLQLKENIYERIENIQTLFMVSLNTYEGNIQQEHIIIEPITVDKLMEEIHGLKLENETLKIHAVEREKMIRRLTTPSNNGSGHQKWYFVKRRSWLSKQSQQNQTNNRFLPLEATINSIRTFVKAFKQNMKTFHLRQNYFMVRHSLIFLRPV